MGIAVIIFRCRTDTLKLGWRMKKMGGEGDCKLCGEGEETLEHFLLKCIRLRTIRDEYGVGEETSMEEVLLLYNQTKETIYKQSLWREYGEIGK
jgi:hypothetical protein